MIETILSSDISYWVYFLLLLFGGETLLVPLVYMAFLGKIDIAILILIAFVAAIISDSFWYWIGHHFPRARINKFPVIKRRAHLIDGVLNFLKKNSLLVLVLSKFAYGTRIAIKVGAGISRIGFVKYNTFNIFAVAVWTGFLYYTILLVDVGVASIVDAVKQIQLTFLITVAVMIVVHLLIKKHAWRKLFKQNNLWK